MSLAMATVPPYTGGMKLYPSRNNVWGNRAANVLEWILALLLILGGFSTALQESLPATTQLEKVFGSQLSFLIFGVGFFVLGVLIVYFKVAKKGLALATTLMVSYLFLLFASLVELFAFGNNVVGALDAIVMTLVAAWLYIRARMINRYV